MSTNTPIRDAVIPLIKDAQDRAEKYIREYAEKLTKQLAEVENDLARVHPYPRSSAYGRHEYKRLKAAHSFAASFVKHRSSTYRPNGPELVDVCPERIENRVKHARESAALQYEAFILKLEKKIGPTTSATLNGNHVWSYSILNVVKPDGTKESWKTKTIINVSPLGTLFNQWPTLKMKKAEF